MDGPAIVMLLVGAVFLWGGLLVASAWYWRGSRRAADGPDPSPPDAVPGAPNSPGDG